MVTIASTADFRTAARRRLPRLLFDYAEGGAYAEQTLRRNETDLGSIALRQRVLGDVAEIDLSTTLFGHRQPLPVALGPVGIEGMSLRRGEVQAGPAEPEALWFQLYVLRDRGFRRAPLAAAQEAGARVSFFTIGLPVPSARYRDAHPGMSGPRAPLRRILQAMWRPGWAWDGGLRGRPYRPVRKPNMNLCRVERGAGRAAPARGRMVAAQLIG